MPIPVCQKDKTGTERYFVDGLLHREDGPAVVTKIGGKSWYKNGKLHREDGPAIEEPDGTCHWNLDGRAIHIDSIIDNPEFRRKYPALVVSMLVYLVHNS